MIPFLKSETLLCRSNCLSQTFLLGIIALGFVITSVDAEAQDLDISGTTWVTDWPETRLGRKSGELAADLDYSRYNLLPFIDSLAVHYRFSTDSSPESLSMHFEMEWVEGEYGIVSGRKVGIGDMPPGIVIESIDLVMKVIVDDGPVADFFLPLDTIGLGPAPSMIFIDIEDVNWSSIFVDVGEEGAREIFKSGFRLSSPRIVRAIFTTESTDDALVASREEEFPSYDPLDRTVFIPDIDIWIDWSVGRDRWIPPPGAVRKTGRAIPREMGRTRLAGRRTTDRGNDRPETDDSDSRQNGDESESGRDRTAERGGGIDVGKLFSPKNNDDDDDDEDRLYPAALAGLAMVGGLAVLGGTIGFFSSTGEAPIGLMSGYVEPNWGALLHVSINEQVFGNKRGPENLIAGVTGFYNVFNSQIQPAIGIGGRITEEGTDELIWKPSLSIGLVGNFGQFVLLAGYDMTTPDFRLGLGINLRHAK